MDELFGSQKDLPSASPSIRSIRTIDVIDKSEESFSNDAVSIDVSESDEDSLQDILSRDYDKDRFHFRLTFFIINILGGLQLAIILYILSQWLGNFQWHPDSAQLSDFNVHLVCTHLGCVVLGAYAILLFRAFPNHSHQKLAVIHTVLSTIVVLISAFGIKVSYDSHAIYGTNHLYSLHSWMGVSIFGLLFFELVTGNWLFFNEVVHASLKYWHTVGGQMLFVMSLACTVSGILNATSKALAVTQDVKESRMFVLNTFGLLATLFSILVRYLYIGYRFRRRPRPGLPDQDIDEHEVVLAIVRNDPGSLNQEERRPSVSEELNPIPRSHSRASVAPPRRLTFQIQTKS